MKKKLCMKKKIILNLNYKYNIIYILFHNTTPRRYTHLIVNYYITFVQIYYKFSFFVKHLTRY